MTTPKDPAGPNPRLINYDELIDTLIEASANGCVALVSAKLKEDGNPALVLHVIDITITDQKDLTQLIQNLVTVVTHHSTFVGGGAHVPQ